MNRGNILQAAITQAEDKQITLESFLVTITFGPPFDIIIFISSIITDTALCFWSPVTDFVQVRKNIPDGVSG